MKKKKQIKIYLIKLKKYKSCKNGRVGQTDKTLRERALTHLRLSRKGKTHFHQAIRESGIKTIDELMNYVRVLKLLPLGTSDEEATYWENYYKKKLNTIWPNGLNEKWEWPVHRGENSPTFGMTFICSDETKKKLSNKFKGKKKSKEHCKSIRKAVSGNQIGKKNSGYKPEFTDENRKEAIEMYETGEYLQREVARKFNVSQIMISRLVRGKSLWVSND